MGKVSAMCVMGWTSRPVRLCRRVNDAQSAGLMVSVE